MYYPNTTYRIQFHRDFNFGDLRKAIPYLHQLGIKTIYASPIFSAMPGSMHGYDGIDTNCINPEIGTLEEYRSISKVLKDLDIGWIQDFVPNHMAYTSLNPKIADLMEKGRFSDYYNFFDIKHGEPLMAPFLGSDVDSVLENKELQVIYDEGQLSFKYYEDLFPLNYHAWLFIAEQIPDAILNGKELLSTFENAKNSSQFSSAWKKLKEEFKNTFSESAVSTALQSINANTDLLKIIYEQQFYRLCYWQETNRNINYRRFFTINGLIGVNIQQPEVFEEYHKLLFQLIEEGIIQGVRIDHIDGLYNPGEYLNQLRERVGSEVYIVVEKILEAKEDLTNWPIQGTTGYDFLAQLNNLLISVSGKKKIAKWYDELLDQSNATSDSLEDMKALILEQYMKGEWENVSALLHALTSRDKKVDITIDDTSALIKSMLIHCEVYRYYPDDDALFSFVENFKNQTKLYAKETSLETDIIALIIDIITPKDNFQNNADVLIDFWRKFMQLSGPLMAKGMEDTLMYRHPLYLANNEVGDSSFATGSSIEDFHRQMLHRQSRYPLTMNATATHDTKRGEDARSRLQLIAQELATWIKLAKQILNADNGLDIAVTERYAILQAVYASMQPSQDATDYSDRLKQYIQKAAREGKKFSNWEQPDERYEEQLYNYAISLTDINTRSGNLLKDFVSQHQTEMQMNSIVQLILKCTCPGVADIYQGTELEDLCFVDPDNRRNVDYKQRLKTLNNVTDRHASLSAIATGKPDNAKLYVLHQLLKIRQQLPALFEHGIYQPIETNSNNTVSFIRRYQNDWLLVVLPLGGSVENKCVQLKLPADIPDELQDVLSGENIKQFKMGLLPGVYYAKAKRLQRNAGLLLSLFSLPSPQGIGDIGKEAYNFVKSISRAGQSLWQMLPINPVTASQTFSPYASTSAFAAEPMYIDLHALHQKGYLSKIEIDSAKRIVKSTVDYEYALGAKDHLLHLAYTRFVSGTNQYDFKNYCIEHQSWLDSYCNYVVLKNVHDGKPWYEWPEVYRNLDMKALDDFEAAHKDALNFERWKQFVFDEQWRQLKSYCKALDIKLVGDVPFYMAKDSADVWAHQSFFEITADGEMTGVAGVPPDYFSETGQLWGMPVYNWKALQKDKYKWWMQRLERNVVLFDIVRLDHFRAFYDYWEVKGDAENAIEGMWKDGPQTSLFNLIKKQLPDMPFIAEDLGEIHDGVFRFKDKYKLPGMRILQFGFEQYDSILRDLPHNFNFNDIAYTGTHDNDTIVGWYNRLSKESKDKLERYAGVNISSDNIAPIMIQMLYQSIANTVIVPVQDVLHLNSNARINTPATIEGNWKWIFKKGRLSKEQEKSLFAIARRYNRI